MIQRVTLRLIEGVWYECFDVGCPDFDRAEVNREMLRTGHHPNGSDINVWWRRMEAAIAGTPLALPLPKGVPFDARFQNYPVAS